MIRLRAVLFQAYFVTLTLVMGTLGGVPVRVFFRHRGLAFAQSWVRLVLGGLRAICRLRVDVTGLEHLPAGPVLIASQHQSEFDGLIWMILVPRPAYVLKRELTRIPVFGPLLLTAGMIPIDRGAGGEALRGLLREAEHAAADARQIVIFPQGTRVDPGHTRKLHYGIAALAEHLNLKVIPVATNSGDHWRRGFFDKRPGAIKVALCPPIPAGTSRDAILPAIEAAWRRASAGFPAAVDKSVDVGSDSLSDPAQAGGETR